MFSEGTRVNLNLEKVSLVDGRLIQSTSGAQHVQHTQRLVGLLRVQKAVRTKTCEKITELCKNFLSTAESVRGVPLLRTIRTTPATCSLALHVPIFHQYSLSARFRIYVKYL